MGLGLGLIEEERSDKAHAPDEHVELEDGDVVALREVDGAAQRERLVDARERRLNAIELLAEPVPRHDARVMERGPPPVGRVRLRDLKLVACAARRQTQHNIDIDIIDSTLLKGT